MSLDSDFRRHLDELAAEVSESLRSELEEHKRQLLWKARQTHNSAAVPIAYSEASIYGFHTRVEKTIGKYLEALESCGIVVDGSVESEMLEIIRPLTAIRFRLTFPPALSASNLSAVQDAHARELTRVGSSLYRQAANRLREARIKAGHRMSVSEQKGVPKPGDGDVPTVFVSYSWDSKGHKEWVLHLSADLTTKGGAKVVLDQWDLRPGGDRTLFMERSVVDSDFVLVVCTPTYATKANERTGGVGYEAMIITSQLARSIEQEKFIPVLRSGDWASSSPVWLQSKIGVDLSGDPYDQGEYERLVRTLHNEHVRPPAVGPKPRFEERPRHTDADSDTAIGPAASTERSKVKESVKIKNRDGAAGPLLVTGSHQSAQDASMRVLYGVLKIINYTQHPVSIAPLRLVIDGKDWPVHQIFFQRMIAVATKDREITVLGNHVDEYRLTFMFASGNSPEGKSGTVVFQIDAEERSYPVTFG